MEPPARMTSFEAVATRSLVAVEVAHALDAAALDDQPQGLRAGADLEVGAGGRR
jgi:hypothetical protein